MDNYTSPYPFYGIINNNKDKLSAAQKAAIPQGAAIAPGGTPLQAEIDRLGLILFANKTGATLALGKCLIPETTLVTVYTTATFTDATALTLAQDLSTTEVGTYQLVFTNGTGAFLAGTIAVVGKDENGSTITETITTETTLNAQYCTSKLYTEITSITPGTIMGSSSTLGVTAYPVGAMKLPAATADLTTVTGVCYGAINGYNSTVVPDEGYGWMATRHGAIMDVLVDAADQAPGTLLTTSGSVTGNLGAVSAAAHGGHYAKLIGYNRAETSDAQKLKVQWLGGV